MMQHLMKNNGIVFCKLLSSVLMSSSKSGLNLFTSTLEINI